MKLGRLSLKNNLILAPMLNITSPPYRRFCRDFHKIGLVCVPMLYTKRLMKAPKSIANELHKIEEERPISVQLIGSDPEALKRAIVFLESYEFDVIDINAGCPSRRAIKAKEGGYLLKNLKKLEDLLKIAAKFSSKSISLKSRLGFEKSDSFFINELAKILNESGIEFLTIHARPVKSRFEKSSLDLDALKELKEKVTIPIVGNGDINGPKVAKKFVDYTNIDAIMIGRGSIGNPEIFGRIFDFLTKGIEIPFKNNKDFVKNNVKIYEQIIDDFLDGISLDYSHDEYKFKELKKNSIWLTKNIEDSTNLRRELSKANNLKQLRIILNNFFEI